MDRHLEFKTWLKKLFARHLKLTLWTWKLIGRH